MRVQFNKVAVGPVFRAFPKDIRDVSEADAVAFERDGAARILDAPIVTPEPAMRKEGKKK